MLGARLALLVLVLASCSKLGEGVRAGTGVGDGARCGTGRGQQGTGAAGL